MRVHALSDIHVDYPENLSWIEGLDERTYGSDALILAGDVTHRMDRLETALAVLRERFARVFYVPGNHEPWLRDGDFADSLEKLERIFELCARLDVSVAPEKVGTDGTPVWIVPLLSWYVKPEEGPESLYLPRDDEDPNLDIWADDHFVRWPAFPGHRNASEYFLARNRSHVERRYDAEVISFSHFCPRLDILFERGRPRQRPSTTDARRRFNFSRVAGSTTIDAQIREIGAAIHVYGHQHRNRYRRVDGVLYVSHCLGYPHERGRSEIRGIESGPRLIWDSQHPAAARHATEY